MPVNLPNILTVIRIVLVPVVIGLIVREAYLAAFWLFVLAGVTDAVDGALARYWDQITELGSYLDPLADKALLVSVYITLAIVGAIPGWLALIVVSRDVMIVGAVILSWLMNRPVAIAPVFVSKANTLGQIVFAALVLGVSGYGIADGGLVDTLMIAVALLTIVSCAVYLVSWLRHMTGMEPS